MAVYVAGLADELRAHVERGIAVACLNDSSRIVQLGKLQDSLVNSGFQ